MKEERKIAGIYIRVSTEEQAREEHCNKDTLNYNTPFIAIPV